MPLGAPRAPVIRSKRAAVAPTATLIGSVHTDSTAPHGSTSFTPSIPADTEDIFILISATIGTGGTLLSVDTVTVDGNAATEIVPMTTHSGTNGIATSIWRLTSPPTGSQQIVVTYDQSNVAQATAVAAIRALDVGSVGATDQEQGTSSDTASCTFTTQAATSTLIMIGGHKGADAGPYTALTDVDELADSTTGGSGNADHSFFVGRMDAPTVASYQIGATATGNVPEDHGAAAVELKAA